MTRSQLVRMLACVGTWSVSTAVAGDPPTRVPFAGLSSAGSALTAPGSNGEPRILKDRTLRMDAELFGFAWAGRLTMFKSANLGNSWESVGTAANQSIGGPDLLCAAQDSAGRVHLLFKNGGAGTVDYVRIALVYHSGSITGFKAEAQAALPGGANTNVDVRATLQVVLDSSGVETLVYQVNDNPSDNMRIRMGKATSLTPTWTADFVKLDGTPGETEVFSSVGFNNHDHSALFAQLGASRDLWLFWGPVNAEYGAQDATFTTRLGLTASGPHSWTVGTPVTMVGSDATSSPELLCVYGTQNYVWLMYLDPRDGLSFDRVAANGTYTHGVLPSPEPLTHRNGWGVFSVSTDEQRIWAIWNTMSRLGPGVLDKTTQGYWNGAAWTLFSDPMAGDSYGMGGTLAWDEGVVAMRVSDPGFSAAVSTIRGVIVPRGGRLRRRRR